MSPADEDPRLGRALHALARGQQAQAVYQFLEEYFEGRQKQLDHQLFEAAEEMWANIVRRKIEVHLFLRNLTQLMKAGESSGRILQPLMELQSDER